MKTIIFSLFIAVTMLTACTAQEYKKFGKAANDAANQVIKNNTPPTIVYSLSVLPLSHLIVS